jgi:DmsE family decaheme c-type cytochrome
MERKTLFAGLMSVSLVIFFVLLLSTSLRAKRPVLEGENAQIERCAECHETQVEAFKTSLHGKRGFELRSDKACDTCHGPSDEHVETGDKDKIRVFGSLSSAEKSEICLTCHESGQRMYWDGSTHHARGLACQDCHSMHSGKSEGAQLKEAVEADVCFGCHKQKASQFFRASHHPIREGKVSCTDCHNPHGTESEKLIDAQRVNDKCYECHAEKRGPFLWEHQPVREDCTTCHEPHGSNHLKLVNARLPFLCQRCHSDTRHPGTLYDQGQINSTRLFNRACTNCHSMIHGSNHPSGHTFLR